MFPPLMCSIEVEGGGRKKEYKAVVVDKQ